MSNAYLVMDKILYLKPSSKINPFSFPKFALIPYQIFTSEETIPISPSLDSKTFIQSLKTNDGTKNDAPETYKYQNPRPNTDSN